VKAFLEQKGTGSQWNMVGSVHQLSVLSQLQPRQTGNYQFGWPVSGYQPGGTYRVEAPMTITNHSSYLGQPYGPTPKADVGYTVNEVNGTVAVVDSDPDTGVVPAGLSQSGSFAYDYQVTGDHTDIVQVLSAHQNQVLAQASATVKVNVWSLDIAKAVTGTSFTRTYNWSLGKPDPASVKVHVGEQASYSVPVTVTATDSGWKVEGTITIHNPPPSRATSAA